MLGYRRGPDGQPEIVPEEAEVVKRIYRRYLDGCSLAQIKRELEADGVPTASGIQGWTYQVIRNILTNERYIGDALLQKTYTTDCISKTVKKNQGALTAQQAELLDKVLEDMENEELNAQLKATMEEKQAILGRLGALQQDEAQRAGQETRLRELAEWLKQQNCHGERVSNHRRLYRLRHLRRALSPAVHRGRDALSNSTGTLPALRQLPYGLPRPGSRKARIASLERYRREAGVPFPRGRRDSREAAQGGGVCQWHTSTARPSRQARPAPCTERSDANGPDFRKSGP